MRHKDVSPTAIPTDDEIRSAIARARKMRSDAVVGSFRRLFHRNSR